MEGLSDAGSPSDVLIGLDQLDSFFEDAPVEILPIDDEPADRAKTHLGDGAFLTDTSDGGYLPEDQTAHSYDAPDPDEQTTSTEAHSIAVLAAVLADSTTDKPNVDLDKAVTGDLPNQDPEDDTVQGGMRSAKFEVILYSLPPVEREKYITIRSNVVDEVLEEVNPDGESWYEVEFTDGRRETIPLEDLVDCEGGEAALWKLQGTMEMNNTGGSFKNRGRKRSWMDSYGDSDAESNMDLMELDEEETPARSSRKRSMRRRQPRLASTLDSDDDGDAETASSSLRQQHTTSRQSTRQQNRSISDEDNKTSLHSPRRNFSAPRRQLRERTQKQLTLTSMAFSNVSLTRDEDLDELSQEPYLQHSDEDDDNFMLVTSDLISKPSQSRRKKSKRFKAKTKPEVRSRSRGSSIEFEDRRRSGRSTRNKASMIDVAMMDEDSFYIEDTAPAATPKVINIKEVFKQLPHDSSFTLFHSDTCSTCNAGSIASKGSLIGCQGCSMSFHRSCLGYRSAREHIVTKIGVDDFVLQCKYCIGFYNKKDKHAPRHHRCQKCEEPGRSCEAFSPKRTPRQEEKIRAENGGEDPITPVDSSLINNADNVLFRCVTCKRGWHYEHLPSSQMDSDVSDIRDQRLSEYSVDWKCHDCGTISHKIQTLVAWRPANKKAHTEGMTYSDLFEDEKEYLIKWQDFSYFHCSWMPGAWVFHIAAGVMRSSFAKKDADQNLALKMTKDDAIPEEYLLPDVIFAAKVKSGRGRTLEEEMERIESVDKIYVKFQGLGYDEAVWDKPPKPDAGETYSAFKTAYYEYLTGKYFSSSSNARMRERVNRWKEKKFIALDEQPQGIRRGNLMAYQLEGVNWLLYNYHEDKNVILADEMGLGKTVQVVSLISALVHGEPKCWPFLVVVPNSTCPNWRREIKQWAPDLRVVTYHGGKQPQELAYNYELFPNGSPDIKAHVVVMSYDSAQDERTRSLFRSVQWAGLVVDEGQRLKNDKSLLYLALRAMKFPFRLLLTGTPLQNNKRELFNLLQFIDPTQNAEKLDEQYQELNAQNLPELHGRIKQYFLRRTKAQVLKFLPPMAQIIVPVSMSILQEKLCKSIIAKSPDLIKAIFADDKINKKERGSLNNILMQLRKCLCHPFMYSEAIEERTADQIKMQENLVSASGKLMLLNTMLPKLKDRGHRVLIFSQFLNQLDIIEDFLNGLGLQYRRLDGKINSHEKQKHIDAFNAPDSPIFAFLLSTRAGGVGINLATADTVIILDPDFNPHQDIQAISRAHRIGQKHKVLCFQLMTKNSAEEKIMQIGRKKMALDHVLIEAMDEEGEPDDLESILKFGASALFSDDQDKKDIIRYDEASIEKLLDRSHVEQTETGQDESAESTFSFARVWANDKGGFEDDLVEENEPIVNPNVWEEILAEREAEAKRIAELNKEVLGRGGRRRQAVNYKTNAPVDLATDFPVDHSASSDNDEDFVGEDEENDTDMEDRTAMKRTKEEDALTQATQDHRDNLQGHQSNSKQVIQVDSSKTNPKDTQILSSQGIQIKWQPHATANHRPNQLRSDAGQAISSVQPPLYFPSTQPGMRLYPSSNTGQDSQPPKDNTPVNYKMAWLNNEWKELTMQQDISVQIGSDHKHHQATAGSEPYQPLSTTNIPERVRRPSFGLSQISSNAATCAKCGFQHLSTHCPKLTSEIQLRLALDSIKSWPSNARNPGTERALREKLHAVATNKIRRQP